MGAWVAWRDRGRGQAEWIHLALDDLCRLTKRASHGTVEARLLPSEGCAGLGVAWGSEAGVDCVDSRGQRH